MAAAILTSAVHGANIYRSVGPDDVESFSTQPVDASYKLFMSDPFPTVALVPLAARPKKGQRALTRSAMVETIANKHAVDAALVHAVIDVESRFNPTAVSPKGAVGLMQLMPATAAYYGVTQRIHGEQNVDAGVRLLRDLLLRHDGNVALTLAAYNAGEGRVSQYGRRIPPYPETLLYVAAVLAKRTAYQQLLEKP